MTLSGNDLEYSPFSDRDWGFMKFDCKIEAMISYMWYLMVLLWNAVWTYDLYVTVNRPLAFNTERYIFYYKILVYFTGLIVSLVVFFPNYEYFAEVSQIMHRQTPSTASSNVVGYSTCSSQHPA